jgi:ribosome-associated GTPase EngA
MAKKMPVVGLAGRRNAGKSSLFNALLGKNRALTHETPGLTRDILRGEVNRYGMRFQILDLPGLDLEPEHGLDEAILQRARQSIDSVDLLLYLMEPPAPAPFDLDFLKWLRTENRSYIVVINKIDAPEKEEDLYSFYEYGLNPAPVSATSRYHLKDLCERIQEHLSNQGVPVLPQLERPIPSGKAPWQKRRKPSSAKVPEDREEPTEEDPEQSTGTASPRNIEGSAQEPGTEGIEESQYAGPSGPLTETKVDLESDYATASEFDIEYTIESNIHGVADQKSEDSGAATLTEATVGPQFEQAVTGSELIPGGEDPFDRWQKRERERNQRSTTISDDTKSDIRISLVGKQNAGKSSLFNRLVNEEVSLVSDIPGTTRDTLDTVFRYQGRAIRIIDTAGLKKRGAVKQAADFYSMRRTLRAMQDSEVVIHLIDGLKGVTDYDKKIQAMIARFARPSVLVVNKWDAVPGKDNKTQKNFLLDLQAAFRFAEQVPVLFISALTGKNTLKILEMALELKERSGFRINTAQLNQKIKKWLRDWPGKSAGFRILYATQPDANPPVFLLFINDRGKMQRGFPRFIENRIRDEFALKGIPIRVFFRERGTT